MVMNGWPMTPHEHEAFRDALEVYKAYVQRGSDKIDLLRIHFDEHVMAQLLSSSLGQIHGWADADEIEKASASLLLLFSALFSYGFKAGKGQAATVDHGSNGNGKSDVD